MKENDFNDYQGESCTMLLKNMTHPPRASSAPAFKCQAIHVKVDKTTPQNQRETIGLVFSPKTKEFPAGIKTRLVAKISTCTDSKACLKDKQ